MGMGTFSKQYIICIRVILYSLEITPPLFAD